jgi:hypothetical protein
MSTVAFRPAAGSGGSVRDCEDIAITSDTIADLLRIPILQTEMLGANHSKTFSISRPEDL